MTRDPLAERELGPDAPDARDDAAFEALLRADAAREVSRLRSRPSLRSSVIARLDEPAPRELERSSNPFARPRVLRWAALALAAASLALVVGFVWRRAQSSEAPLVHVGPPAGARDAGEKGAPPEQAPVERTTRGAGESLARLSVPALVGRGTQPARALAAEVASWERDTRAAARFLISRVRLTPPEKNSGAEEPSAPRGTSSGSSQGS